TRSYGDWSSDVCSSDLLALVDELDANAGVQERELAQPFREDVVVELDVGEDLRARPEADDRTAIWRLADRGERRRGLAEVIFLADRKSVVLGKGCGCGG